MALKESRMVALGSPAPDFALPDVVTGRTVRLADFASAPAMRARLARPTVGQVVALPNEQRRVRMAMRPWTARRAAEEVRAECSYDWPRVQAAAAAVNASALVGRRSARKGNPVPGFTVSVGTVRVNGAPAQPQVRRPIPSLLLGLAAFSLAAGCAWKEMSEEEKRVRLFLAPGTLGLSVVAGRRPESEPASDLARLLSAADRGDNELVVALVASGKVAIDATDKDGWFALKVAARADRLETAKLLLKGIGSPPVAPSLDARRKAMEFAAQTGKADFVRLMIENGVSPNTSGARGLTPLMRAAYSGHTNVIRVLLEAGADTNVKDSEGNTVFHWARMGGCVQCDAALGPSSQ